MESTADPSLCPYPNTNQAHNVFDSSGSLGRCGYYGQPLCPAPLSEYRNTCQSLTSGSLDQREAELSLVCKRPRPAASQAELVCQWVCASGLQDPAVPTSRILIQHQNRQLCLFEMTVSKDGFIIQKKYGIPHPHPYPHLPSTETINTTTGASTVCHRACRNAQVGERGLSTLHKNREGNSDRRFQKHSLGSVSRQGWKM